MKKIFKSILVWTLMMLLVLNSTPLAFASNQGLVDLEISLSKVEHFENNKDVEVELQVENSNDEAVETKLITGLFNCQTNEMETYSYVSAHLKGNESYTYGICIPVPSEGNYMLKSFAWDDMSKGNLLSNTLEISMEEEQNLTEKVKEAISLTGSYLKEEVSEPQIGSIGGEWAVFGLARSGLDISNDYIDNYYNKVIEKVKEEDASSSRVWSNKVTEVERVAIALSAIGKNPEEVGGVNLLDYIWNKQLHFPGLPDGHEILGGRQGANELIYGLLSVNAKNYEQPQQAAAIRDFMIETLLNDYQVEDGGFTLSKGMDIDLDITAMTLQSLAPYYNSNEHVKIAVSKALTKLSNLQGDDGFFVYNTFGNESKSSETISQVIVALTELGINPAKDERFIKNNITLIDALLSMQETNGSFLHEVGGEATLMSTEQAFYALVSIDRLIDGKSSLYNMTDVETEPQSIGQVTVSIEKRTIGKGDTLKATSIDLIEGDRAWDVIKRALDENEITYEHNYYEQFDSVYIKSIDGDGEFDHGSGSGWKYSINDEFPNVGVSQTYPKNGDEIRLRYCLTFTSEELNNPLVELLKTKIDEAKQLKEIDYTKESYAVLKNALGKATLIAEDSQYNSKETEKELIVSPYIKIINDAVEQLVPQTSSNDGIPEDFENDLWLQHDFKELKVGETAHMVPRRTPEGFGRPNYNFEIIEGDSVTLTKEYDEETGNAVAYTAEAVKEGTTIIKVTYDKDTYAGKTYPACSTINAAYVVYNVVGNKDTDIEITHNIPYDSYDTVYYTGDNYELSFTADAEEADIEVTCNGKTIETDGEQYVAKLENRSNIICISATNKEGNTRKLYKVIDARNIEINIANISRPGESIGINDEVEISFKGITMPVYKLATIYNPTSIDIGGMFGEDVKGTYVEYAYKDEIKKGLCEQYDLSTNNTINMTFDEKGNQTLTGGKIYCSWWGEPLGTDKEWDSAGEENINAFVYDRYFSYLPDITINVGDYVNIFVDEIKLSKTALTLEEGQSEKITAGISPDNARNKDLTWTSSNEKIATVDNDGNIKAIATGNTVITVTANDGGNANATCQVEVIGELPATDEEKAELGTLLEEVRDWTRTDNYTDEVWNSFDIARTKAQEVYNSEESLLADVNSAYETLTAAKENLLDNEEGKLEAYEKLQTFITEAEKEISGTYPENFEYWEPFIHALENAQNMLKYNTSSTDEFNTVYNNLEKAKSDLDTIIYSIKQEKVENTTDVMITIEFDNITIPDTYNTYIVQWKTVYSSNIPNMSTIETENLKDDKEKLKILEFVVPAGVKGNFKLNDGYIFEESGVMPMFGIEKKKHYLGKMPVIEFTIE